MNALRVVFGLSVRTHRHQTSRTIGQSATATCGVDASIVQDVGLAPCLILPSNALEGHLFGEFS